MTRTYDNSWSFKVIDGFADVPIAGLAIDAEGNLYGTGFGDPYNYPYTGIVFKLTPEAGGRWKEQERYPFGGGPDGGGPSSSVALDAGGNLYGSAGFGGVDGCDVGCGVIFAIMK